MVDGAGAEARSLALSRLGAHRSAADARGNPDSDRHQHTTRHCQSPDTHESTAGLSRVMRHEIRPCNSRKHCLCDLSFAGLTVRLVCAFAYGVSSTHGAPIEQSRLTTAKRCEISRLMCPSVHLPTYLSIPHAPTQCMLGWQTQPIALRANPLTKRGDSEHGTRSDCQLRALLLSTQF